MGMKAAAHALPGPVDIVDSLDFEWYRQWAPDLESDEAAALVSQGLKISPVY